MTYRIGGQVVDQGSGVADQPVFVVDTADADPTNWTVEAATTTNADGSWSVVVPSGNVERYHAVSQVDDSGTLKNSESQPYLTAHPELRPARVDIQFNVPAPQSIGRSIPDSVVSRPDDDASFSNSDEEGMEIELKSDWPSIGARISNNTSGATRAFLRESDSTLITDIDVSSLSSGDVFTFDDVNLTSGNRYWITLSAEGSSWTIGVRNGADNYPYTSNDVDITARVLDGSSTQQGNAWVINDVGELGV